MINFYNVVDPLKNQDLESLDLYRQEVIFPLASIGSPVRLRDPNRNIQAIRTGEKRPPRKGEWYLSGAIAEAYRAPNDLSTPYHIAKLVVTETVSITRIVNI